jgi:hypothetical protein
VCSPLRRERGGRFAALLGAGGIAGAVVAGSALGAAWACASGAGGFGVLRERDGEDGRDALGFGSAGAFGSAGGFASAGGFDFVAARALVGAFFAARPEPPGLEGRDGRAGAVSAAGSASWWCVAPVSPFLSMVPRHFDTPPSPALAERGEHARF